MSFWLTSLCLIGFPHFLQRWLSLTTSKLSLCFLVFLVWFSVHLAFMLPRGFAPLSRASDARILVSLEDGSSKPRPGLAPGPQPYKGREVTRLIARQMLPA